MNLRDRRLVWVGLSALALAVALHAYRFKALEDFLVFRTAGERFLEGASLYRLDDGVQCFKYAPAVAGIFAPLGLVPLRPAELLWLVLSAALLMVFWVWTARSFGPDAQPWWHLVAFVWVLPFLRNLFALGQSDLLVLAVLAGSEALARRRPVVSGLLWAVACLFKLPFLILVPVALLLRQWKRLGALGVGVVLGLLSPAARYGFDGALTLTGEWRALLQTTTPPMICGFDNQSLYGIVCRYAFAPERGLQFYGAVWSVSLLLLVGAGRVVIHAWHRDRERAGKLAFAVALYLSALLSPLGWRSNLVVLLPLIYLVVQAWPRMSTVQRVATAGLATANTVTGLLIYDLVGKNAFNALIQHRAIGLCALLFAMAAVWASERPAGVRSA